MLPTLSILLVTLEQGNGAMNTLRKTTTIVTAALSGLVLLTAVAMAHGTGGQGQTQGSGGNAPAAGMGSGMMTNPGGNMGSGMMNPGTMAPGTTVAPMVPCPNQGNQTGGNCGNGGQNMPVTPNQQTLPPQQ
jgi:hypothetical protein